MRKSIVSALMLMAIASSASAQYSNFPRNGEPAYWLSGGVGAMNGQGVQDGSSSSTWDFGGKTSWQYRATIEKAIQNQSTIGIVGTYVKVPFTYSTNAVGANSCSRCAAHLDMVGLQGQFHAGGGVGFHQIIEIAIGATAYRNLTQDSNGMALAPLKQNLDGSFSLGYGFGYGLSTNSEVTVTQDYGMIFHESTGLTSGTSNTNTVRSIRMAFRYGFGLRQPGVRRR